MVDFMHIFKNREKTDSFVRIVAIFVHVLEMVPTLTRNLQDVS